MLNRRTFRASFRAWRPTVIEYDVTLNYGETIGFSAEDKHAITRSEGAALPGMTLKIEY